MKMTTNNIPQGKVTPLGIIPNEWEILQLKKLGEIYSGGTPNTNEPNYWNGNILWCTPSDITKLKTRFIGDTNQRITPLGLKNSSATLLPPGSILVCTRATIGNAAITIKETSTNQGFKNIKPIKGINVDWLFYYITLNKHRFVQLGVGSTFLEVSKKDFENFKIIVPTLPEQQKIAEVLSTWDKAIEKQSQLIEKLELRKKGLMQQLLTGKKRLSGFNGEWEKEKLGDIVQLFKSNTLSRERLGYSEGTILNIHYGDILIKYPTILDVSKNEIPFILDTTDFTSKDYINNGDVIMADTAEDGSVGKVCEIINVGERKIVAGLHTIFIHPTIKFAPMFLGYYLNSDEYHKQILSIMQGIKVYSITKDALKKTYIKTPCIKEQYAIAEVLLSCDEEINLATKELELLQQQKKGLMQILLTGKKRLIR